MKGVKIEFFDFCKVFGRVISFLYQKFYLSDRVPLSHKYVKVEYGLKVIMLDGQKHS